MDLARGRLGMDRRANVSCAVEAIVPAPSIDPLPRDAVIHLMACPIIVIARRSEFKRRRFRRECSLIVLAIVMLSPRLAVVLSAKVHGLVWNGASTAVLAQIDRRTMPDTSRALSPQRLRRWRHALVTAAAAVEAVVAVKAVVAVHMMLAILHFAVATAAIHRPPEVLIECGGEPN